MAVETVEYGKCPVCGYLMLPVLPLTPCGHEADPELTALTDVGTVYSWSEIGIGERRVMVMADFFDGELRVTAPLDGDVVGIGDQVRLVRGADTPYQFQEATAVVDQP